jgi:hypothetical protein
MTYFNHLWSLSVTSGSHTIRHFDCNARNQTTYARRKLKPYELPDEGTQLSLYTRVMFTKERQMPCLSSSYVASFKMPEVCEIFGKWPHLYFKLLLFPELDAYVCMIKFFVYVSLTVWVNGFLLYTRWIKETLLAISIFRLKCGMLCGLSWSRIVDILRLNPLHACSFPTIFI